MGKHSIFGNSIYSTLGRFLGNVPGLKQLFHDCRPTKTLWTDILPSYLRGNLYQ
jgi:hypothetical protein